MIARGALVVFMTVWAVPAAAQTGAIPPPAFTVRVFGDAGFERFTATRSFTAILGQDGGTVFGGGGEVVFGPWFARVNASRFRERGERAIRLENQTFHLGIPLTVTIVPIEVNGGYRFRRHSKLILYAGAGASTHSYKETSTFADSNENVNERFTGYQVLGGVEYRIGNWLGVAGEIQYTAVPDAIGAGGLSQEFGEKDLGGTVFRARFLFGH